MKDIQSMTEEIKGKQAAYRLQEERRRNGKILEEEWGVAVMKTHERVSFVNLVEIVVFFAFSVVQIIIVKRWFSGKTAILG